jgi:hypothetical protein
MKNKTIYTLLIASTLIIAGLFFGCVKKKKDDSLVKLGYQNDPQTTTSTTTGSTTSTSTTTTTGTIADVTNLKVNNLAQAPTTVTCAALGGNYQVKVALPGGNELIITFAGTNPPVNGTYNLIVGFPTSSQCSMQFNKNASPPPNFVAKAYLLENPTATVTVGTAAGYSPPKRKVSFPLINVKEITSSPSPAIVKVQGAIVCP